MKTVAIIQARIGSTRLPRKVLLDLGGTTMLARVINRTRQAASLDEVIIATTVEPDATAIVQECEALGVPTYRGSVEDVLERYYQAAQIHQADIVVRITSDCPFIDSAVIDTAVNTFQQDCVDYLSNTLTRTFPHGLDVEVMPFAALQAAHHNAAGVQRVHVTPYIYQNTDQFKLASVTAGGDYSHHRWTVDTPDDLRFARALYARLDNRDDFTWQEALAIVQADPELAQINAHVQHKKLEEG